MAKTRKFDKSPLTQHDTTKTETKNFLLDTSVILDDVYNVLTLSQEGNNNLFITDIVMSELDHLKDNMVDPVGRLSREFWRLVNNNEDRLITLDHLPTVVKKQAMSKNTGDIYYLITLIFDKDKQTPIHVPVTVITRDDYKIEKTWNPAKKGINDAKIREIAQDYKLHLITNDGSFKFGCRMRGVTADGINNKKIDKVDEIDYHHKFEFEGKDLTSVIPMVDAQIEQDNISDYEQIELKILDFQTQPDGSKVHFISGRTIYGIARNKKFEVLDFDKMFDDFKVAPFNEEQKFFSHMLLQSDSYLTVATGATGSGKTLMALQAGINLFQRGEVDGIIYARNTVESGTDKLSQLGFRKGDEDQKLGYFMYPLFGAINFLLSKNPRDFRNAEREKIVKKQVGEADKADDKANGFKKGDATEGFMQKYNIELVDIAHLRGTTISNKFVIIDESQNMSDPTLKLIGTRMGEKTRLCLLGDPKQIDHPFLSSDRNALASMLQKAKNDDFVHGIRLKETVRSAMAKWFDKNL